MSSSTSGSKSDVVKRAFRRGISLQTLSNYSAHIIELLFFQKRETFRRMPEKITQIGIHVWTGETVRRPKKISTYPALWHLAAVFSDWLFEWRATRGHLEPLKLAWIAESKCLLVNFCAFTMSLSGEVSRLPPKAYLDPGLGFLFGWRGKQKVCRGQSAAPLRA